MNDTEIERPKTDPPKPAYSHWYHGDLTLEQAQELFPIGATVRFFRGGGRLFGGMTGKVVAHYQDGDPMSRFGGRAGIKVDMGGGSQRVAGTIGAAIGVPMLGVPVQKISDPFNSCEVVEAP